MPRHFLKSSRETAMVLLGVPLIIATIFAWLLFLTRNSNEIWGFFDLYEFHLSGGQVVIWTSDHSQHLKLDKPDLILLVWITCVCSLAWVAFMIWRSSWRRRGRGAFPVQLSRQTAEPIALEPLTAIPIDGPARTWAGIAVLAASPRLRRIRRTVLWCALAAWLIWVILSLLRAEPPTAAQHKSILDAEESKYLAAEGHQRRGKAFAAVAGRMDVVNFPKKQFTWSQVQNYLGPPDWYEGPLNQPNVVVYFYDRYAKKDAAVFVMLDSQGRTSFGWSMAAGIGPAGWSAYPTTLPATMPANAKP